jgi:hypothetical protein
VSANGNGKHKLPTCNAKCDHGAPTDGKCNAHNKARSNLCRASAGAGTPHLGSGKCWLHGARGGAPRGPRNGNWKHGASARVIVPLNAVEEKLLTQYVAEGYKILDQVGHAKLLARRALGYALETGDVKVALEALRTVASVAGEGKRIAEGAVVRVVFDESVVGAFVEMFIDILAARVPDRALVALVAQDLTAVDWTKVSLPAVTETVPAEGERT